GGRVAVYTLRAFGGLSLQGPDGLVTGAAVQRRKLALLTLLAVAGERGQSRDKLIAIMWPESEVERARHVLTQTLSSLRRELRQALGREATAQGDHPAAARWWRERARLDPLDSGVAHHYMEALVCAGDRAAAVRHAHIHDELMIAELGVPADKAIHEFEHRL